MQLYKMTWPEVEDYLKKSKKIIIPVGSTEQHGPTGPIGIDFLTAWDIAIEVGNKNKIIVASPLCYGMALHHMAFPGTATLKPSTYIKVIEEIIASFISHGFNEITIINGHGGNIAPITSALSEIKQTKDRTKIELINWWHLPEVTEYEKIHFKDQNGFHATCGEISVTMHKHPDAFLNDRAFNYTPTPDKTHWPLSPIEFREIFNDGRMGSNPKLANAEHGAKIFEIAAKAISHRINNA